MVRVFRQQHLNRHAQIVAITGLERRGPRDLRDSTLGLSLADVLRVPPARLHASKTPRRSRPTVRTEPTAVANSPTDVRQFAAPCCRLSLEYQGYGENPQTIRLVKNGDGVRLRQFGQMIGDRNRKTLGHGILPCMRAAARVPPRTRPPANHDRLNMPSCLDPRNRPTSKVSRQSLASNFTARLNAGSTIRP